MDLLGWGVNGDASLRKKSVRIEHVCSEVGLGGSERRREPLSCYLDVLGCPESENDAEAEAVMGIWLLR